MGLCLSVCLAPYSSGHPRPRCTRLSAALPGPGPHPVPEEPWGELRVTGCGAIPPIPHLGRHPRQPDMTWDARCWGFVMFAPHRRLHRMSVESRPATSWEGRVGSVSRGDGVGGVVGDSSSQRSYVSWLQRESMLTRAGELAAQFSGSAGQVAEPIRPIQSSGGGREGVRLVHGVSPFDDDQARSIVPGHTRR